MTPFTPHPLPPQIDWARLVPLLGPANRAVASFDEVLRSLPNPALLLSPLETREAVLSSKIEGTEATLEEVLDFDADGRRTEKYDDIQEVINYRKAMRHAVREMEDLPLSLRLIRDAHAVLLAGVRGEGKTPGEFRRDQNWIGPPGCTMETATYVPPSPTEMMAALDRLEKYFHDGEQDTLVQLGIVHAQFEIIHPFRDGNGRLGRMLLPLFLFHKKILSSPNFYLSEYLETHRRAYYDGLRAISERGAWTEWCEFFLRAVTVTSAANTAKARAILALYERLKIEVPELTHSQWSAQIVDFLCSEPVFTTTRFRKRIGVPQPTAHHLLTRLTPALLRVETPGSGRSPSKYAFDELLGLLNQAGS